MQGFNKVIIVGTLGADPQTFKSREGKDFTALSLATNRWWRNKEGNVERRTDWHRVTVWGKKASLCQNHLKKGATVCVEGYLSSYEVEEAGKAMRKTIINAEEVNFLTRPPNEAEPQSLAH